jgi:imidazolonepropionase-like amidohydrolase
MRAPLFASAALALSSWLGIASAMHGGTTLFKAGTVHTVDGEVLTGGAAVLVRDGAIVAVGKDLAAPGGARVVDYGPGAVIVPGLVSAGSAYGGGAGSPRTVDPSVRAIDSFDVYSRLYVSDLMGGVTTSYVSPARSRLVGGQGAVVRLAGDADERVLDESSSIHGTITASARSVPGFWEPPIPATVDVGLGVAEPQLPGSAMGAVIALDELLARVKGRVADDGLYGPQACEVLRELMRQNSSWRMGADSGEEVRVLLDWARREQVNLVIEGASGAGALAADLAAAKVPVIVTVDVATDSPGRDFGTDQDARRPVYDAAAKFAAAGVEFAIGTDSGLRPADLRFAAQLASRGGLPANAALRAITLGAAKALGVDARVGSLTAGKDADLCVLDGAPMSSNSNVLATWVRGELAWKRAAATATVIEADELHLGDGHVLRPGQVMIKSGRIAEVGERVSHPPGSTVLRAKAAMPGMIDALGFLGLAGSTRVPQTDFKLARIVEPGDRTDRLVAKAGVTTVVMAPRGTSDSGAPLLAYKPAASDVEHAVVADPSALRVQWTDSNRLKSGVKLRETLDKAKEYDKKWRDYEEALKKWVPPAASEVPAAEEKKDEKAKEGEKKDEKAEEKKDESSGDKKDEKNDKKKAKKEEEEADPVTGIWKAKITVPPSEEESELRLRLELEGGKVKGSLRCDAVSASLVQLAGVWKDKKLFVMGLGTRGFVRIEGEAKGGKFEGTLKLGAHEPKLAAERESKELPSAKRPEMRREKKDEPKEPKGKPKAPGIDARLEPFRRAMKGEGAIVVNVDREDEILACVAAFEAAGIKPVLYGAEDAWRVAKDVTGRISGVLLTQRVLDVEDGKGLNDLRNRYEELSSAGIPIAFHSAAEDGAAELPLIAAYAVSRGLGLDAALRGLTSDAARMMGIASRVGRLAVGLDGDVLLLDGPPLEPSTSVLQAIVNGEEVR